MQAPTATLLERHQDRKLLRMSMTTIPAESKYNLTELDWRRWL